MFRQLLARIAGLGMAGILAGVCVIDAQMAGKNGGPNGAADGSARITGVTGSKSPFGSTAGVNKENSGGFDQGRPVFLSGSVLFDDGSQPNSQIRIERVCNGNRRLESHTDSKGHFSFQVGGEVGNNISDADASNNSFGTARSSTNGLSEPGSATMGSAALMGCELQASYPGYVSDRVPLSMRHSMDDPKVGTILLHHLGNVKGTTISLTTAEAPKSAQKAFDKGNQLAQKGKFEEAEQRFASATSEYPKFAAAWFAMGEVEQRLNKLDDAKKAFLAAIAADNHYVSPFDQLAMISAEQGKWEDAAKYSKATVDLNPVEFPSSFWYNTLANYNLQNFAEAEKSVRALIKLDSTRHKYPLAETMMASFASNRGDLDETAAHLRAYLAEAPNAKNVYLVKRELDRVLEEKAVQAKNMPNAAAH